MSKIGRNDPCHCGSGKEYKQCHSPIDAKQATIRRKLKQAPDTLLTKVMAALDRWIADLSPAISLFWNGRYTMADIKDLDEQEDRGSERFLTWFAFDMQDAEGLTPVQRLIADPADLELTDAEMQVLAQWSDVRLQPYEVIDVRKGQSLYVRSLFGEDVFELQDQRAAQRILLSEVLIAHLVPAADTHFVAGAAAHLTSDTLDKLREYTTLHLADLQQAQPDATYNDLIRSRSYIFNHFMMALPREEGSTTLEEFVAQTRVAMHGAAEKRNTDRMPNT